MRGGMIDNWEMMEKFWHRSIHQMLRCEPSEHIFILVCCAGILTLTD